MNRAQRRSIEKDLGMSKEQAEAFASEANEWMGLSTLVAPGPNATSTRVVDAMVGGKVEKAVRISIAHSNGVSVIHMPPPIAAMFADQVAQAAKDAATGLEVVRNG